MKQLQALFLLGVCLTFYNAWGMEESNLSLAEVRQKKAIATKQAEEGGAEEWAEVRRWQDLEKQLIEAEKTKRTVKSKRRSV